MKSINIIIGISLASLLLIAGCSKDFLDKKPSTNLIVPATFDDFQRLLDDYQVINGTPGLGEASSDDYYLKDDAAWNATYIQYRNAYIWKPDLFEGTENIPEWNTAYRQIFVTNVVLEGLDNMDEAEKQSPDWNYISGWAHFVRGHAFFNLAQLFAPVYDASTAPTDLGIPLRLKSGVDEIVGRSNVQDTYSQITTDLQVAASLLPSDLQVVNRNRPSGPSVYGLLARVYLSIREYEKALEAADRSLALYDKLIDYNEIGTGLFSERNDETLYQGSLGMGTLFFRRNARTIKITTELFESYREDDLRKPVFFNLADTTYRNSYNGRIYCFGGIATDEVYLIKAECLARLGRSVEGMEVLNQLWMNRADSTKPFIALTAGSPEEALEIILNERRKELIFRGLRWQDLRRLNKEGASITIMRSVNGKQYTLEANSPLYVLPIPPDEIRLSGIPQNERF